MVQYFLIATKWCKKWFVCFFKILERFLCVVFLFSVLTKIYRHVFKKYQHVSEITFCNVIIFFCQLVFYCHANYISVNNYSSAKKIKDDF